MFRYGTEVDFEMAAIQYRMASETQHNAQAIFNLGEIPMTITINEMTIAMTIAMTIQKTIAMPMAMALTIARTITMVKAINLSIYHK